MPVSNHDNPEAGFGHAALAVLKLPFSKSRQLRKDRDPEMKNFFGLPANEFAYMLFPPIDAATENNKDMNFVRSISILENRRIQVETGNPQFFTSYHYYFDFDLKLIDARPTDHLIHQHIDLYQRRILDHALTDQELAAWKEVRYFPTAPDGNSPEIRAGWALSSIHGLSKRSSARE